ncbi:hypothetical protein HY745_01900 [Candidatus Desantisbacteria bacterium]|nr:hypothetical protein [Candidatus Desantisbacteria bacterium]
MFKFFNKKSNEEEKKDIYIKEIENIFSQEMTSEELIKKISELIDKLQIIINEENIYKIEKTWRALFDNLFIYLSKIGISDSPIRSFTENIEQNYFNLITQSSFTQEKLKEIFTFFTNLPVSNDYFLQDFIHKFIDKTNLEKDFIENILGIHLKDIIQKQSDAYLSNTQYSLIKNERLMIVELLLNFYEKNNNDEKYLNLALNELHGLDDYLRLINFAIRQNNLNDAVLYCFQGIHNDSDNHGAYFEKLAEIYEKQNEFLKAIAYRTKSLYITKNKNVYFKIKKMFSLYPDSREYNSKIIKFLRDNNQYDLLIEIFLEEKRIEDVLEIALLPEISIEEKYLVAEHTKKDFPEDTLILYKEILKFFSSSCKEESHCEMINNCLNEIKQLYNNLDKKEDWKKYLSELKNFLPEDILCKYII